jgi:hypothetical protein
LAVAATILLLASLNLYYVLSSSVPPSTDEGHYLTGAVSIASGLRSGTLAGAWSGYVHALGFKAPLVCVPAALAMVVSGGLEKPSLVSLVITFILLGCVAYSLFLKCLSMQLAAAATALLLMMPMITGLTHRFYVELMLVTLLVAYLRLLAADPWRSIRLSAGVGLVLGLGTLCKITFPALAALPTLFSLAAGVRGGPARNGKSGAGVAIAGLVALVVAAPWYRENWRAVFDHAKMSASTPSCYYPHWALAYISSGPGPVLFLCATAGLFFVVREIVRHPQHEASRTWVLILLSGLTTIVFTAIGVNKATRFTVTALPTVAALACAPFERVRAARYRMVFVAALLVFSFIAFLQNSFAILPLERIRVGEVSIIDTHYPLNVPGWFQDNHPLDTHDYHLAEAEELIGNDARTASRLMEARITQHGLLVDFDYFQALAAYRGHPVHFMPWPIPPETPDYILRVHGFRELYPGSQNFDFYPRFEADLADHRIPYALMHTWLGPGSASVMVYKKTLSATNSLTPITTK